ncbi:hypothetical protein BASA81_004444 [Batrachochytrium salamandrivorans]|nr:hypothetical protein BASA81_004444 [Batrachochytrium salamandrivorans]
MRNDHHRPQAQGLPWALLGCYFLAAFTQSVPMVAFGIFLNEDIKMSFEEQARFYALTFIPWSLKPLYSMVMEYFGPAQRPKFVFVFSIGSGMSLLLIAGFVSSVPEMYAATLLRSFCEAIAGYGLSLTLIDFVVDHKKQNRALGGGDTGDKDDFAAFAQSRATTARMLGSLIAFLLCLTFLYGCGGSALPQEQSPRGVIAFASLFAFGTAVLACFLHTGQDQSLPQEQVRELLASSPIEQPKTWRIYLGIILFQSFFVWIGVYSLIPFVLWLTIMLLYVTGFTAGALATYWSTRQSTLLFNDLGNVIQTREAKHTNFSSGLFLFCLNASPTTNDVWFGFKMYALQNSSCFLQILLVVGECSSVGACWIYPKLLSKAFPTTTGSTPKHRAFFLVVVFTVLSSVIGLVTDFVLAARWQDFKTANVDGNLAVFCLVTLLVTFFGQVQMLAEQVFVTENCASAEGKAGAVRVLSPGMWYGIFLSLLDFGGSASGWISAPIIGALNLDYLSQNYSKLWVLVLISLVAPMGVMLVFAAYFRITHNPALVDDDNGEEEDDDDDAASMEGGNARVVTI